MCSAKSDPIPSIVERWAELDEDTRARLATRGRLISLAGIGRGRTVPLGAVPVPELMEGVSAADLEAASQVLTDPPAVVDLLGLRVKGADLARWLQPDLAAAAISLGIDDRRLRVDACRVLTSIISDRWPGHTIEVRVPPAAAVQCGVPGDGPQHTRGTPPNVVETDPATFVALGVGALTWAEARASHRVRASGNRSELSWMFPLV